MADSTDTTNSNQTNSSGTTNNSSSTTQPNQGTNQTTTSSSNSQTNNNTSGTNTTNSTNTTSSNNNSGAQQSTNNSNSPSPSSSPSTSNSDITGYKLDSTNTLLLQVDVPFSYKLSSQVDDSSVISGYIPAGIYLDKQNGKLIGTPTEAGNTVLTLIDTKNPSSPVNIPVNVTRSLRLGFVSPYDSTNVKIVSPTLRSPGDTPAINIVAHDGSGDYTFSITGDSKGLSIDSKTGVLSGNLPTDPGSVTITVQVSDGITSISAPLQFYISKEIPITYPLQTDRQWWLDLGDSTSTGLLPGLISDATTVTDDEKAASAYSKIMSYIYLFIADTDYRAVPYMQLFVSNAFTLIRSLKNSNDPKIQSLVKTSDFGTFLTLSALLNVNGGSSQLGANMTNVAKVISKYQENHNQGVGAFLSGSIDFKSLPSLTTKLPESK